MADETFGQVIRRLRLARNWTQEDLAEAAGIDQSTVSQVELDKGRARTVSTVRGLARAFGRDEVEFLERAGLVSPRLADSPPPVVAWPLSELSEEEIIAYVESRPGRAYQDRLARLRAKLPPALYHRLCLRLFRAWSENSELMLDSALMDGS